MDTDLIINNQRVELGEETILKISVGKLPSGTRISLNLHVYRAHQPGPTLLVLGGVHGDEINGIETVRRAISEQTFENLNVGSIIAIPILNIYGFINFSRDVPDGKDVNRSFPGNNRGSLASRVARTLTKSILPAVDIIVDYHTGGSNRYNYPQIRYTKGDDGSFNLAKEFAAPYLLEKPVIPKSLRKTARDLGIPIVVFEGGESLRLDALSIDMGLTGLKRLMFSLGMTDEQPEVFHNIYNLKKSVWLRANTSGILSLTKTSGQSVVKGEPLGVIHDPFGRTRAAVNATRTGYIVGHTNSPVVNQGDAIFHIGYNAEEISVLS